MDIRERKFRRYLESKKMLKENYVFSKRRFSVQTGYDLMRQAIKELGENLPTAFFVASDPIAVGCLQALNEAEISVPNRTSVISINNISVAKYVSPPLTTYAIDVNEMSKNAIDLLLERLLKKRKIVKTVTLGSELIIRKSTN